MKWWNNYDPQEQAINTAKKVTDGHRVSAETGLAVAQVHATLAMVEQLERIGDLLEKLVERP